MTAVLKFLKRKYFEVNLPKDILSVVSELKSGDICIDVGANIGMVSEIFLTRGAEVYAFEPHPDAFKKLLEVKKKYENFTPLNQCAGITNGKVKLFLHASHHINSIKYSTGSSLMDSKPNVANDFIVSEAVNFSEFLTKFPRIRILKIDIEGYEVELVPHLIRMRALKNVEHVFVETHEKKWPDLTKITTDMKQLVSESSYKDQFRWDWP
jgi:FkbM family methyltransferase